MDVKRPIAALLLVALLAGPVSLASARPACAMPRAASPASCERCAGDTPTDGPTLKADQACCRVATAPVDREVARIATPPAIDSRSDAAVLPINSIPPAMQTAESRLLVAALSAVPTPIPLRTTVLLI